MASRALFTVGECQVLTTKRGRAQGHKRCLMRHGLSGERWRERQTKGGPPDGCNSILSLGSGRGAP